VVKTSSKTDEIAKTTSSLDETTEAASKVDDLVDGTTKSTTGIADDLTHPLYNPDPTALPGGRRTRINPKEAPETWDHHRRARSSGAIRPQRSLLLSGSITLHRTRTPGTAAAGRWNTRSTHDEEEGVTAHGGRQHPRRAPVEAHAADGDHERLIRPSVTSTGAASVCSAANATPSVTSTSKRSGAPLAVGVQVPEKEAPAG
jgi:hypothetical protein